jgi:hypothetical protein
MCLNATATIVELFTGSSMSWLTYLTLILEYFQPRIEIPFSGNQNCSVFYQAQAHTTLRLQWLRTRTVKTTLLTCRFT